MGAYLQLRWAKNDGTHGYGDHMQWLCFYELVLPLDEYDIRRENSDGDTVRDSLVIRLKEPSARGSERAPCENGEFDAPYRDGAHSGWDSAKLGNLPIFVISPDGAKIPEPEDRIKRRASS